MTNSFAANYAYAEREAFNITTSPEVAASEVALLGCILWAGSEHDIIGAIKLEPEEFYDLRHTYIAQAMITLHRRHEEIDNLTVIEELRRVGQLELIGGSAYITYLINETPYWRHYDTYARTVREAYRQRKTMALSSGLAKAAFDGNPALAKEIASEIQHFLNADLAEEAELRQYLIHVSELDNLRKVTWLIPGEIPEIGLVMYFGPSGVGKSFIALDKALELSEKISVVYIAAEGEYGFAVRVKAWCNHHKKDPKKLRLYFFMNVVSLMDDIEREQFMKIIEPIKPQLIVVDTVAHCMLPGNENDTREMGMFIRGAKAMQKKFTCATLLVHHTNKGGKVERGNQSLRNACDVIARITDDDDVIAFECSKSKDAQPFVTRFLRLLPVQVDDDISSPVVIQAEKVVQSKTDPLTRNQQKVVDALKLEAYKAGLSRTELMELTEIPNGSIGRVLSALIKFGHISQSAKGEKYQSVDSVDSVISVDSVDSRGRSGKIGFSPSQPSHGSGEPQAEPDTDDSVSMTRSLLPPIQPSHDGPQLRLLDPKPEPKFRPTNPCPTCGSRRWILGPVTGDYICGYCADVRKQAVMDEMAARKAAQGSVATGVDEEETQSPDEDRRQVE